MTDFDEVNRRLAETIAWCHSHMSVSDPTGSLRSLELRPVEIGKVPTHVLLWAATTETEGVVDSLCSVRRSLLTGSAQKEQNNKKTRALSGHPTDGRLLCYLPYANLADGAAEEASRGFFDADNMPPWDTWVWFDYLGSKLENGYDISYAYYLVTWVPQQFITLADAGIVTNPEECILWLDDYNPILKRRLEDNRSGLPHQSGPEIANGPRYKRTTK